jgi:AbrB family looped-hinge helix DNA binding protein
MSKKTATSNKFDLKDKMYGTTTLGTRGQVVIPAQARKDLKLKPGDQLIVMGKLNKVVGLMKADQIEDLVAMVMEQMEHGGLTKAQIREQAQHFLKLLHRTKH